MKNGLNDLLEYEEPKNMDLKAMSYMKFFFAIDSDNYYDVEDILIEGEDKPPYVIKKGEKIP